MRNDRLAQELSLSFIKGDALTKLHALESPWQPLEIFARSATEQEAYAIMRSLIEEDALGSKNPEVQKVAKDRVEAISKSLQISVPVPPANELYSSRRRLMVQPRLAEETAMLAKHCAVGAEAIYDFVRATIHYTGEGGDNFKRALHTLMVGGGDCDCVAILLGALLRSLGYAVYLKLLPGHVFAGVVLGKVRGPIPVKDLPAEIREQVPRQTEGLFVTDYVMVPLELSWFRLANEAFDVTFDAFDIFNGEFERILTNTIREILTTADRDAQVGLQELSKELVNVTKHMSGLSGGSGRYVISDERIAGDKLVRFREIFELFDEQAKAFAELGKSS
jgi:hypothetical protein